MEEIRKRMMAQNLGNEFFPAVGSKQRLEQQKQQQPRPLPSPTATVITLSSDDSSPAAPAPRSKSREAAVVDSDDGGDSGIDAFEKVAPATKARKQASRLVIDSDSDGENSWKPTPSFPVPHPAPVKPSLSFAAPDLPGAYKSTSNANPLRPSNNATQPSVPPPVKKPATIIPLPSNSFPPPLKAARDVPAPVWETFDVPDEQGLYDPKTSAADAEKALQDLVAESMNDTTEEIDMSLAEVRGFREGIRLLPHQVVGRMWMTDRESGKKMGGILADDMGLGKTIQTLTRIVDGRPTKSDKVAGYAAATLVICPVSLVSQWASEIHKMAVGLRVIEHHGPSRTTDPEDLKRAHVVITSYSIVASEYANFEKVQLAKAQDKSKSKSKKKNASSSDSDSDSGSDNDQFGRTVAKKKTQTAKKEYDALFHLKWWRIVLDEAHNIKNRKTKAAVACCELQSKFRWCLTGTPLQNNVEELFSLLQFLRIRPLNDWETFNNQINKPVKSGRSVRAMKRLHVVLKAVMLRRKKDTLLNGKPLIELPDRVIQVLPCEFDSDEQEFYNALAQKVELTLNKFIKSGDMMKNYTCVMVLLLRLRQACNHPSLVSKDFSMDKEAVDPKAAKDGKDLDDGDDLADLFGQMGVSSSRKCQLCQSTLTPENRTSSESTYCTGCEGLAAKARRKSLAAGSNSLPPDSAKIRKIIQLLRDIDDRSDGEEKTIIFSQFTSMLDLIQPFLREAGVKYVRYDGSMRKDQREASLEKIRSSKSVTCILISFKAGSTGLNLTACNNVILVDLWWNPALEDQAFDRAHRYGQTRQVNIFKLTIEKTVEERILQLQDSKRQLAAAALSGDKLKNMKLGMDDLMALFRPGAHEDEED